MSATAIDRAITHFNAEDYRAALLAFEERWASERSDELRALILLSNALNQIRLGLITGPRRNLASAATLLATLPSSSIGLDIAALRAYIATLHALIPSDIESGAGHIAWENVPRLRLTRT